MSHNMYSLEKWAITLCAHCTNLASILWNVQLVESMCDLNFKELIHAVENWLKQGCGTNHF